MKKRILSALSIAAMLSLMVACQSNKKSPEQADTTQIAASDNVDTAANKNVVSTAPGNGSEIVNVSPTEKVKTPQFTSEEVNEGFAKFEPLKEEYAAAIASKDAAKIKEVTAKYNEWVKVASNWGSKLTKEENQVYIDHYQKLAIQWEKLTATIKK